MFYRNLVTWLFFRQMYKVKEIPCISAVQPLSLSFALISAPYSRRISTRLKRPDIDAYISGVAASFVGEFATAEKQFEDCDLSMTCNLYVMTEDKNKLD